MEGKISIEELPIYSPIKAEFNCHNDGVCSYELPIRIDMKKSDSEIQVDTTEFKKQSNARNYAQDSKKTSSKIRYKLAQIEHSKTNDEIRKTNISATQSSKDDDVDDTDQAHDESKLIQPRNFENVFKCTKCDKKFYKKYLLEAHTKGAHDGVERPFCCPHCPSNFRIYLLLNRHVRIKHPPNDGSSNPKIVHNCISCEKKFNRKDHLKEHIRAVHEKLRPFKCSICEKMFGSKGTQLRHEKSHSINLPYACKHCDKHCKSECELNIHLELHTTHPDLLCPICKSKKSNPEDLQKHIAKHEKSRRHLCPKCGKIFTKLNHLREHDITVHLKLRPYKCRYCGLAFGARKSLRLHERNHDSTDRSENCSMCQLFFKTKRSLALHMRKFHPNEKESEAKENTAFPFDLWI